MHEKQKRVARAVAHILVGVIVILAARFYVNTIWYLFFLLILGIILSLLSLKVRIPVICHVLDSCELDRNIEKLPGKSTLFFVAGCLLVIKFFPQNIALASIAILTFADPISHFASNISAKKYNSRILSKNKNFFGTILAIIIAFFSAVIFIPLSQAIAASVVSMLAESLVLKVREEYIDDNFIVPVIAGLSAYLVSILS
jgi:dolichol kinase